ncbi:hypothetical protein PFISCL1PPCAC_14873 [Pristionchus fissidentatus]|uniref:SSD domain-containing protein n=1 Tax=Pristionchus fissidentatus TaxID=1538716 RepID=A0AAV5VVM6_9BILA|nr:hypothetical protein PFISCL1PPCAC_14873 [Pristionchus fissidentatus]
MHEKTEHEAPFVVRYLEKFLYRTGLFVADHHTSVLIFTLVITAITSVKVAFTPQEDDIKTGYTPFGARSLHEMDVYNDFFAHKGDPIASFLLISAKDGKSLTRPKYFDEVIRALDFVSGNVTHLDKSFYDLCSDWCLVNEPIRQFANGLNLAALSNDPSLNRVNLTFPVMEVLGKQFDLSPNFFGVQQDGQGSISFLRVVGAQLRADVPNGWSADDVKAYERNVSTKLHREFNSTLIDAYGLSLTYTADEIVRTGMTIFPYIAIGFLIMCVFSIVTLILSSLYLRQSYKHRISMAILGCVCPLLATSSALGLLFWMGFRFGSILCVTPFLILAIGVDDAYLTIQSWIRMRDLPVSHREKIAKVLVDVGPSISITSLTNFLAFAIGIYTPTPEIQLFCIGNVVAVIFDYIYQLTMYVAIVSISGAKEIAEDEKKKEEIKNMDKEARQVVVSPKQVELSSSTSHSDSHSTIIAITRNSFIRPSSSVCTEEEEGDGSLSRVLEAYSDWLSNGFTTVIIFLCLLVYWWMSIKGALSIKILLSPDKLVIADSKLIQMNYLRETYINPNYTTVNIFVNKPGDLDDPLQLRRVKSIIESFEDYPECLGAKFSHFWLRDYEEFIQAGGNEESEDYEDSSSNGTLSIYSRQTMKPFLEWPEFQHLNAFVRFDEHEKLSRFFATVSYHGDKLGNFDEQTILLNKWRATADAFSSLGVDIFHDNSQFIDQVETILPATLSTSFATLFCMIVVCFIFMYNLFTVLVASSSIASICIGVFGLLSYWGIDLDPISMATTIMSIGFSVDFPAHVTYHYFREGLEDSQAGPAKRIARALVAIGFPLLQCGISTILFVCCLLFVPTYMSEVFVKTMILVVSLGLVHGLMVVPVFLCTFSNLHDFFFSPSNDTQSLSSFARILRWRGVSPSTSDKEIPSS